MKFRYGPKSGGIEEIFRLPVAGRDIPTLANLVIPSFPVNTSRTVLIQIPPRPPFLKGGCGNYPPVNCTTERSRPSLGEPLQGSAYFDFFFFKSSQYLFKDSICIRKTPVFFHRMPSMSLDGLNLCLPCLRLKD